MVRVTKRAAKPQKKKVEVYEVSDEPEKKKFDGYIEHPWHALAGAALVGAIVGFLFFWRKKKL